MPRIARARREEHEESRRNQILEAALRVWVRDGFHSPVEAIAREAGLAKGTIYLYFPNKEAVLRAAIERFSLLPVIGGSVGKLTETPPEQAIPAFIALIWERLKERAPVFRLILSVGGGVLRPENARVFFERVVLPGNTLLAAYLDHCIERGALRPLDTFVAARALLGSLVTFVLSQELLGGGELRPITDDAIVQTLSDLFLRGALAPESRS